jgi:hypothetical protein
VPGPGWAGRWLFGWCAVPVELDRYDGDWIKRGRWDLVGVNTLPKLRRWLEQQGITAAQFKRLDVYQANVDRLPWLRDL